MGLDLSTRAGALRFAELRRGEMTRYFLAHGKLEANPRIYIFAQHESHLDPATPGSMKTGAKLPQVIAIPCKLPEDVKQQAGPLQFTRIAGMAVEEMARATKAVGVLVTMDAWYSSSSNEPEDQHYGWIEENKRGEGLYMSLEHRALPQAMVWTSVIHRDPLRLDPWEGGPRAPGKGRLANFVDWQS